MKVYHSLKPIYDKNSKVLILGTMPSVKSREVGFYYAHPKNRFWKTLEKVYEKEIGNTIEERTSFLLEHHIALFDVLKSCDIDFSSDKSIKNIEVNDLSEILSNSKIDAIFTTGRKAFDLYCKYIYPQTKIEAKYLPSTSPANCPKGIDEQLLNSYKEIKKICD
ncbi:MAG: DNA-deoxyinosine glycosylase [Bacilli bacterium]